MIEMTSVDEPRRRTSTALTEDKIRELIDVLKGTVSSLEEKISHTLPEPTNDKCGCVCTSLLYCI